MSITVVVPIRNEVHAIPTFLASIAKQSFKPDEVFFVDGGSSDGSSELIEKLKSGFSFSIRVEKVGPSFPGRSRNIGLKSCESEWVAFMDMGIEFDSSWLENGMKLISRDSSLEVILGSCDFSGDSSLQKTICALTYGLGAKHETVPGSFVRRNAMIEKKIFFPEDLRAGEDLIWKRLVKDSARVINAERTDLHYRSFPDEIGVYLNKRREYGFHEAAAGFHAKYGVLSLGWVLLPLFFLSLGLLKTALFSFFAFFFLRGFFDPYRRSPQFEKEVWYTAPFVVWIGDCFGVYGYLKGLFR